MSRADKRWRKFWTKLFDKNKDDAVEIPVLEEGAEYLEPEISDSLYEQLNLGNYEEIQLFDPQSDLEYGENILHVLNPVSDYSDTDLKEASQLLENNDVLMKNKQYHGVAFYATKSDYDFEGPRDLQTAWGEINQTKGEYKLVSISDYSK